jgi:hypothetical protein
LTIRFRPVIEILMHPVEYILLEVLVFVLYEYLKTLKSIDQNIVQWNAYIISISLVIAQLRWNSIVQWKLIHPPLLCIIDDAATFHSKEYLSSSINLIQLNQLVYCDGSHVEHYKQKGKNQNKTDYSSAIFSTNRDWFIVFCLIQYIFDRNFFRLILIFFINESFN